MRIGVIGAGAIGGAISALLARDGHDVEVTARGANLRVIASGGIRMTGVWGDFTAMVKAGEKLSARPDIAFVATKALDAPAAIRANAKRLSGIPVVVVQNGLESISATAPLLPDSTILGALALYASSLVRPGHIAVGTPGKTYIGGADAAAAARVAELLNSVMPTSVVRNFRGAQWTKLVVNQVNAMAAITGLSVQETIANPGLRRIITLSMRENVRVGFASGIHFEGVQGLTNARLRVFLSSPVGISERLPRLMAKRMGSVPNPGSTLQSIRRGALTEIDYLNGAVVTAAGEIGTIAPVNAALVDLVHEVERTGTFLTPEEVLARF
jgi:2-dehydropantoate 2-reductase